MVTTNKNVMAIGAMLMMIIGTAQANPGGERGAAYGKSEDMSGMKLPEPPIEVAEAARTMVGRWSCEGTVSMMGHDKIANARAAERTSLRGAVGDKEYHGIENGKEIRGTMTFSLDPARYFIVGTWVSKKTKDLPAMKSIEYRTYDPSQQKWFSQTVDLGMGAWGMLASTGTTYSMTKWEGHRHMLGESGQMSLVRMTESHVSGNEVKIAAQCSEDDGKTWHMAWNATCKK